MIMSSSTFFAIVGPSSSTGEHCIFIVFDLFVVRSCLELFCYLSFCFASTVLPYSQNLPL